MTDHQDNFEIARSVFRRMEASKRLGPYLSAHFDKPHGSEIPWRRGDWMALAPPFAVLAAMALTQYFLH